MATRRWRTIVRWGVLIAVAFLLHLVIGLFDGYDEVFYPGADVYVVYADWIRQWQQTGVLVGVGADWVYPLLALAPILASAAFGSDPSSYFTTWMWLVLALDLGALVLLARRRFALAWWWLAFTVLLGPVSLVRLDTVSLALVVPGLLLASRHPAAASAVFAVAAWIKVWPAALVLALVVAVRRSARVVLAAVLVTAGVVVVAAVVGALPHLLSFLSAQQNRGIQIEAPVALPWLWLGVAGGPVRIFFDEGIITWQVSGPFSEPVSAGMGVVLLLGVAAVVAAALAARRRGAEPGELLVLTVYGLVSALIALNKVGSPQYITWLAAPALLGLLVAPARFRRPATAVLVLAGLTQLVYPWFYATITDPVPWGLAILTARNLLELALLAWSVVGLIRLRPTLRAAEAAPPGAVLRPA